ncbi:hypothetical protein Landi51_03386 [Colletotrichum acutatum]
MTAAASQTDDMTKRLAYRLLRALFPFFTFSPTVAAAISHEPQFILLSILRANHSSLMLLKRLARASIRLVLSQSRGRTTSHLTNDDDEKSEGPHVAPGEQTPDLMGR